MLFSGKIVRSYNGLKLKNRFITIIEVLYFLGSISI